MKSLIFKSMVLAAIVLAASLASFGQANGRIFDGETLIFEARVSKLKISLAIAELTFAAALKPDSNELIVKSEAVSKGTMLKMFRYSFLQQYQSVIDLGEFRILKTTKHDVQKQRVRDSEAVFNYKQKRVTYVETDPKDSNRPPRRIASEISGQLNDMISAIYTLRLSSLSVGKKMEFQVSDSGLVYKLPVGITGREQLKTVLGKVWCLRVEPEIFGTNRLIERKGKMVIWLTDDARHTPVKAQLDTEYGKVEIKLKSANKKQIERAL